MQLHKFQSLFARSILNRPDVKGSQKYKLDTLFINQDGSLPERMEIYRNNIIGSLTKALLTTYPLITTLTGEEFATALFRSFVLDHPPRQACLARYGGGLDKFIQRFAPAEQLPYLSDVARLEWAINLAYYADDDEPVTPGDIENIQTGDLSGFSVRLRSSVCLLNSPWPLAAIREFCLEHNQKSQETLNLDQESSPLMVYRSRIQVEVITLNPAEYSFLNIIQHKALGEALGEILLEHPEFDFNQFLQRHLRLEIISNLTKCP